MSTSEDKPAASPDKTTTSPPATAAVAKHHPTTTSVSVPLPGGFVFPLFTTFSTIAWHMMWYPLKHGPPNAPLTLYNYCPVDATPARFLLIPRWLGAWTAEGNHTLCLLTYFFDLLLRPSWEGVDISPGTVQGGGGQQMIWELLCTVLPALGVLYLEAERPGASIFVRYPFIWGLLYQNLGAGVVLPVYYCLLLLTSEPRAAAPSHRGEAVFVGLILGYGVPTLGMLLLPDYRWTLAWQFFPFFVTLAREGWALVRPAAKGEDPGLGDFWARMVQGLGIVVGTIVHVYALLEAAELDSGYARMFRAYALTFLPVDAPTPTESPEGFFWHTLANFLKWDWAFILLSSWVAGLCAVAQTRTGRAYREMLDVGTWCMMTCAFVLMGPGAVVAAVWMWRDDILWEEREGKRV